MKFTYQYRTSDNTCHSGVVTAADRNAAFELLKKQGVKPFGLAEASGFGNKVLGKGKRWIAIVVLGVAVGCLAWLSVSFRREAVMLRPAVVSERHQIYGDPEIIEVIERTGFANVFTQPGERILACFARPGVGVPVPKGLSAKDLTSALGSEVVIENGDAREVAELKAIVNGMKVELQAYLADGVGTPNGYMRRLEERQDREQLIYDQAVEELRGETNEVVRASRNAALRAMGLRTVPVEKVEE